MVTKKKALITSVTSAAVIGIVHYIAHKVFSNPALIQSNIQAVGITVVISVFLISYFGMRGKF